LVLLGLLTTAACSDHEAGAQRQALALQLSELKLEASLVAGGPATARTRFEISWEGGTAPFDVDLSVDGRALDLCCSKAVQALSSPVVCECRLPGGAAEQLHSVTAVLTDGSGQRREASLEYSKAALQRAE
jgi:hypothetical protein